MTKQFRRKLRAKALSGLVRAGVLIPTSLVRGALAAAAPFARFSRYERRTLANLDLALGNVTDEAERRRIASGVRLHTARIFAEWLKLARGGDGAWIDRAVELDPSIERLQREFSRGRGVIVVTAHVGNWELLCARLRRLGLEGAVVGHERPSDESTKWLAAMRRAYGIDTLPQHASAREILRLLQRGQGVGLLADLPSRRVDCEFLPFFGVPALTITAPAALARAAKLPLLPVRCTLERGARGRRRYRLRVDEPLVLDQSLPRREATSDLAARLNRVFEGWIRDAPEQWAWHQPRWRTPPGSAGTPASREFPSVLIHS